MELGPDDPAGCPGGEYPERNEDAEEAENVDDEDGALDEVEPRREHGVKGKGEDDDGDDDEANHLEVFSKSGKAKTSAGSPSVIYATTRSLRQTPSLADEEH